MKLLITVGCGFLCTNLAEYVLAQGYELVVFDSLYREGSIENRLGLKEQSEFRFVHGAIRFNLAVQVGQWQPKVSSREGVVRMMEWVRLRKERFA